MRILMCMTTRNIYVADGDVELFETAAEFAGGMSAAVVAGLRLYVAQQRKAQEGTQMHEIEIETHDGPIVTTKRFTGRQLLRYELREGVRVTTFRAYLTARNQIAVNTRNDPDWAVLSSPSEDNPVWEDQRMLGGAWWDSTERTLRVFPDVEAMKGQLPEEVVDALRRALTQPTIEDLDI
jgi:EXLDI family protein